MDKPPENDAGASDATRLLARVRAGDAEASTALIERLYPLAAKIVRAYLPRASRTGTEEDALQEVFLRVFSRLDQYRATAPLEHWVSRVAVRVCIDLLRARKRIEKELRWSDLEAREAALVAEAASSTTSLSALDRVAARELTDKLLDTLTAEDRVIITLLDIEQRSVAEVAERTGRTKVSVKVRALRARRKLHGLLERLLGEQPAKATSEVKNS